MNAQQTETTWKYTWRIKGTLRCLVPFGDLLLTDEELSPKQAREDYIELSGHTPEYFKTINVKQIR